MLMSPSAPKALPTAMLLRKVARATFFIFSPACPCGLGCREGGVGVSPCSGCETGLPSPPFALRSATTLVPRFAPLRATATSRRAPKGAVGLRHGPTSNGLTAYRMRLHLASAAAGLRPSATPARRPRLRLPGTTGLRFALHGRQRQ